MKPKEGAQKSLLWHWHYNPSNLPNRILCLAQHFPNQGPSPPALLTWGQAWWPEVVASWKST